MKRLAILAASAVIATLGFTGCGGGGGGTVQQQPGRGAMGEASPYKGFIKFESAGTCNNTGYYLTLNFDEDEQGNLNGTVTGRNVSAQNPPPQGDEKYSGPLNATITGKRTGDSVQLKVAGDINFEWTGNVVKGQGFSKLDWDFTGQPGCSDSAGNTHGGEAFIVGGEMP